MVRKEKKTALNARVPLAMKAEIRKVAAHEEQSDSAMVKRLVGLGLHLIRELGSWSALMEAEICVPARPAKRVPVKPPSTEGGERKDD